MICYCMIWHIHGCKKEKLQLDLKETHGLSFPIPPNPPESCEITFRKLWSCYLSYNTVIIWTSYDPTQEHIVYTQMKLML